MKTCDQCGTQFTPGRRDQRFCGTLCSGRWVASHRRAPLTSRPQSEETREKLRQAALGRRASAETRRKLSEARKGVPKPSEWRANIAKALTGNPLVGRTAKAGQRNPNYKHGRYVDARAYRKLVAIESCSECGRSDVGLDVHHIDGDHYNNDVGNLQVLCDYCHGKKHGRPPRRASAA